MTIRIRAGFSLVELLVSIAMMLVVAAGTSTMYIANRNARLSEDLSEIMEAQLRIAMEKVTFNLRGAGYGVPTANLSYWIAGFSANPKITVGSGSAPDTVELARCTDEPVATLASDAAKGATSLALTYVNGYGAADLDEASRRLISINDNESALISKGGNTIDIDTDPVASGAQGLAKPYRAGTPLCRVDVITYSVDPTTATLREDYNGAGAEVVVDGITNLKIAMDTTGAKPKFTVALTARSGQNDPYTNAITQRSMVSAASKRD